MKNQTDNQKSNKLALGVGIGFAIGAIVGVITGIFEHDIVLWLSVGVDNWCCNRQYF